MFGDGQLKAFVVAQRVSPVKGESAPDAPAGEFARKLIGGIRQKVIVILRFLVWSVVGAQCVGCPPNPRWTAEKRLL